MSFLVSLILLPFMGNSGPSTVPTPPEAAFKRTRDIVYHHKYGTALTMDLFEPKAKWNGACVIWVVSGGWYSAHESINPENKLSPIKPFIRRGYKVCAVVHGSNPLFTAEDAVSDIHRSVRNIRHRAAKSGQTTMPIGIVGASAGGHLSLMAGTAGDDGNPKANDPVERQSSRVQAVACYFPPTDFLNYGTLRTNVLETTVGKQFIAPFQFKRLNPHTRTLDLVTSSGQVRDILANISPATHVSPDDAPTLIIQGDNDALVPMQQAELIIGKLSSAGVKNELVRRPGAGHGWATLPQDNELLVDWMDKHLLRQAD